jgi:beta-phosphoglucomutase-like phosphatase (HAD superfamily)
VSNENAGPIEELGAVLFDLDGTLVDSEPLWGVSMDRVAGHLDGSLSPEFRAATTGQSVPFSVKLLLDDIGSERGVEETTSLLLSITAEVFAEDLLWQPGAQQLIDQIRAAGIPVLVVPSEVPVPEGPGRIFASSLLDSTATELQHIHHEFRRYRRAHGE